MNIRNNKYLEKIFGAVGIVLIVFCPSFNFAETSESQKTGIIALVITGSSAAIATSSYYIYKSIKQNKEENQYFSYIEKQIKHADSLFTNHKYVQSKPYYDTVNLQYQEYTKKKTKRKQQPLINKDTLQYRLGAINTYETLFPILDKINKTIDKLPSDQSELAIQNRHLILNELEIYRKRIDSLIQKNLLYKPILYHELKSTFQKMNTIDSMYTKIYETQKLNFSLKCKFFYNRAVETRDTTMLRQFVKDCDYYSVNKTWCDQARMILNPIAKDTQPIVTTIAISESPHDQFQTEYSTIMMKPDIRNLEGFLKKYSGKKYKAYKQQLQNVKVTLDSLNKILALENIYNQKHPYLADYLAKNQVNVLCKGVSDSSCKVIQNTINTKVSVLSITPNLRGPMIMYYDQSQKTPLLVLNAFINPKRDISINPINDTQSTIIFPSIPNSFEFLLQCATDLSKSYTDLIPAQDFQVACRLRISESDNITFYANISKGKINFYDIIEFSSKDLKYIRFNQPNIPNLIYSKIPKSGLDSCINKILLPN